MPIQYTHASHPGAAKRRNDMNKNEAKYLPGYEVSGKHYGRFVVTGSRWSDAVGEYIYGVIQIDANGNKISNEMNMAESCFA